MPATRDRLVAPALLAGLIVLGAFLRLYGLADWHYTGDDVWHWEMAERAGSAAEVVEQSTRADTHPPLYYLLLYGLRDLIGGPIGPRLPALLAGLALIPLFYLLGLRFAGGRAAGLALAATAAFGTELVTQSQTVRQYTLLLAALSAMLLCAHAYHARRRWRTLAGYVLCGSLAIATHHSACIVIAAAGVAWLPATWRAADRQRAVTVWALANALLATIFTVVALPYLGLSGFDHPMVAYIGEKLIHDWSSLWLRLRELPFMIFPVDARWPLVAALPLLLGGVAAWRARRLEPLVLAGSALAIAVALSVAGYFPLVGTRWCLYLLVCLAPLAGLGIQEGWRLARTRTRQAAMLCALAALALVNLRTPRLGLASPDGYRTQSYELDFVFHARAHDAGLGHLLERGAAGDVVLVSISGRRRLDFDLRHRGGDAAAAVQATMRVETCPVHELLDAQQVRDCLSALPAPASEAATVWLFEYETRGQPLPPALRVREGVPAYQAIAVPLDRAATVGGELADARGR